MYSRATAHAPAVRLNRFAIPRMIRPESQTSARFGREGAQGTLRLSRLDGRTVLLSTEVRALGPFSIDELDVAHRRAAEWLADNGHDEDAYAIVTTPLGFFEVYVPALPVATDVERAIARDAFRTAQS